MSIIGKTINFFRAVKQNGGILSSLKTLYITDDLKWGKHVGTDKYGNKYFVNNYYFVSRNRWVIYNRDFQLDYDASQVPPEWHMWLHYTTDLPPSIKPPVNYKWMVPHQENKSGSSEMYYPYSTTRTKIESWMPTHLRTADMEEQNPKLFNVPQNNRIGTQ